MTGGIIREPTNDEKKDFQDIGNKRQTTEEKFITELNSHAKTATTNAKPFAAQVAKIEWEDHYKDQAKLSMRKNGYVDPNDIKPIKMDWAKYSDLHSFEVVDEGEKVDDYLTKINPGLTVKCKWIKYRFKNYSYTYRIMESGPDAIARAEIKRKALNK